MIRKESPKVRGFCTGTLKRKVGMESIKQKSIKNWKLTNTARVSYYSPKARKSP